MLQLRVVAEHTDIIPFIRQAEGGLTGNPADANPAANPSPCGIDPNYNAPYHTNKGITWETYQGYRGAGNTDCQEFLQMSDGLWASIWKVKYWDAVKAGQIENQAIANTYASWAWGSGVGGANNLMKKALKQRYGYSESDVNTLDKRIAILNQEARQDVNQLFNLLSDERRKYFLSLTHLSVFHNGWLSRLEKFKTYNRRHLNQREDNTLIYLLIGFAVLSIATYFLVLR